MESTQKLNVNDLISSINRNQTEADKKITQLKQGEKKLKKQKSRKTGKIAKRQKREMNSGIVNEKMTEYQPIVKKHREATNLDFRDLQTYNEDNIDRPDDDEFVKVVANGKLHSYEGLKEKEQALVNNSDVAELIKAKHLLLYKEIKQKRVKRIKSKLYRKIKKKHREKQKAEELANNLKNNKSLVFEELEKMEYKRAMERASLKHRNNNKYVKLLKKYGDDKELKSAYTNLNYQKREIINKLKEMKEQYEGREEESEHDEEFEQEAIEEIDREILNSDRG